MNTHFPIPIGKPFRGITTIQLFDKNGKMIEEVVHENTYNQRIQFRNYLDTILHCRTPDMSKNIPFALAGDDRATYSTYSYNLSYHRFWNTSNNTGDSGISAVRQPFATLWLTNATANEAPNGYPNGIPVALADSSGVANDIANVFCAGQPNIQESYYGNDRLHLVFDFDTVHGNITFDSLWLYPSYYRTGTPGATCYHVLPFFQKQRVKREYDSSFTIPFQFKHVYQEPLNGPYSMLWFSDTSSSSSNSKTLVRQVVIFNMQTGEILANCTFTANTHIYGSFYYDAGSNQLYMLHSAKYTGDAPFSDSSSSSSFRLYKVNLTTGVRSLVADMNTLLNMVKSDYNYAGNVDNWRYNVDVYWLAGENTTIIAVPTEGVNASTGQQSGYYTWYTFNALTESFDFVKRQKVYSGPCYSGRISPNYSSRSFVRDGKLYLACFISPNAQNHNTFAVFNIKTGALIYDKALSYSGGIENGICSPVTLTTVDFDKDNRNKYGRVQRDDLIYRNATRSLTSNTSAGAKLQINRYDTALWSTHNKLTSAITKTDQTTMKIQYDIIWDSLNDVIIPGLM